MCCTWQKKGTQFSKGRSGLLQVLQPCLSQVFFGTVAHLLHHRTNLGSTPLTHVLCSKQWVNFSGHSNLVLWGFRIPISGSCLLFGARAYLQQSLGPGNQRDSKLRSHYFGGKTKWTVQVPSPVPFRITFYLIRLKELLCQISSTEKSTCRTYLSLACKQRA